MRAVFVIFLNRNGFLLLHWQNINRYGRYEFNTSQEMIKIDEIIQITESDFSSRTGQKHPFRND
jgi:hypothetical protein